MNQKYFQLCIWVLAYYTLVLANVDHGCVESCRPLWIVRRQYWADLACETPHPNATKPRALLVGGWISLLDIIWSHLSTTQDGLWIVDWCRLGRLLGDHVAALIPLNSRFRVLVCKKGGSEGISHLSFSRNTLKDCTDYRYVSKTGLLSYFASTNSCFFFFLTRIHQK
jgi:hypothetical protein